MKQQRLLIDGFTKEIKAEFSDQNWDYLDFIADRYIQSIPAVDQLPDVGKTIPIPEDLPLKHEIETVLNGFLQDYHGLTDLLNVIPGTEIGYLVNDLCQTIIDNQQPSPLTDQQFADELEKRWPKLSVFGEMMHLSTPDELYDWLKDKLLKPQEDEK